MKFKMINKKDIQCVVSEEEMKNYGLNVDDIFGNTQKAQSFLNQILDLVEERTGCLVGDGAKTVQAVCLPGNAVALTFSDSAVEEEKAKPGKKIEIVTFRSLAESIVFSQKLCFERYDSSMLCREKSDICLIVDLSTCNTGDVDCFLSVASEFAENVLEDEYAAAYLEEHATILIPQHALQVLADL